jgi:hypothetical protein
MFFWNSGKNPAITSRREAVSDTDGKRLLADWDSTVSEQEFSSAPAFGAASTTIRPSAPIILSSSPKHDSKAALRLCSKDLNERPTVVCEKVFNLNFARVTSAAPRWPIWGFEL